MRCSDVLREAFCGKTHLFFYRKAVFSLPAEGKKLHRLNNQRGEPVFEVWRQ